MSLLPFWPCPYPSLTVGNYSFQRALDHRDCILTAQITELIFPLSKYLSEFSLSPGVCSNSCLWISDAIQPSQPLLPSSLLVLSLSQPQGLFQWVRSLHQVARVLELQLQICPSNECSGSISFRIDCFDLLAAQGTLKSLLQHHSSKASILWCLAFVMVQISHCT